MAKPKLALIPAAQGSKFYSVLPSSGVGDFDFTRSGSATRINSQGLIETVGNGVSRLNYPMIDGKVVGCPSHLLEPQKINQLQRSQEFSNSYWINNGVTITENNEISPDGTLNADLLTGVSGGFGVVRFSTWTATNKVASCFAKAGTTNIFKIANVSAGNRYVLFDLSNGTVSEQSTGWTGSIEDYGNGWYRCTAISNNETGTFSLGVTAASESVYLWGAQLESDYLTSYIPTTTTAVTRSAETANNSGDYSTFNDSEGVLYVETSALSNDLSERRFGLSDGTSSNVVRVGYTSVSNRIIAVVYNGSNQAVMTYTSPDITQKHKIAVKYKENDFALWVDGIKRSTDTSGSVFSANTLNSLDFNVGGGSHFYSETKDVRVYNTELIDSELEKLTSWTSFSDLANGQLYSIK